MSLRILVVDDDGETARLVRPHLESSYEVLVAHDGEAALQILRRERPDLMLLDLTSPEGMAQDATHAVWSDADLAALPVVSLAAPQEDHGRGQLPGDSLGIDGERRSSSPARDDQPEGRGLEPWTIVARVGEVLSRVQGTGAPPRVIEVQAVRVDLDARQVEVSGRVVHLTPTEFGLLRALAQQAGHALTRKEMIEEGLGRSYEGVERTVDSHVKNLRHKLEEAGEAAYLVQTVFGVGYRLDPGEYA